MEITGLGPIFSSEKMEKGGAHLDTGILGRFHLIMNWHGDGGLRNLMGIVQVRKNPFQCRVYDFINRNQSIVIDFFLKKPVKADPETNWDRGWTMVRHQKCRKTEGKVHHNAVISI